MKKELSRSFILVVFFLSVFIGLFGVSHKVNAAVYYKDWGSWQCSRHGYNDDTYCDRGSHIVNGPGGPNYDHIVVDWSLTGQRFGSSEIDTTTCLVDNYTGIDVCQYYHCAGDSCGYEYGNDIALWNPLPGDSTGRFAAAGGGDSLSLYWSEYVMDADVRHQIETRAFYPDAPALVDGCTDPTAINYDSSANNDDGSCQYWKNLNFYVKNQVGGAINGASVKINRDFGNGTSRSTDGNGFANYGVYSNTSIGYSVSASGCSDKSGTANVKGSDYRADVTLTCSIGCSGASSQSCTSGANACNQTSSGTQSRTCDTSNGNWGNWSTCSASKPANPAHYGDACTGPTSDANACGGTNSGSAGTYQCKGTTNSDNCSGAKGTTPNNPAHYGDACTGPTSDQNACGQTNSGSAGTYQCDGTTNQSNCSGAKGTTPPLSSCPATSVTISSSPGSIAYNGSSTITWTPQNATSCTASGDWSGSKSTSGGSTSTGALTQVKTYTYTISCTGLNGTDTKSATVVVAAPIPSVGPGNPTYSPPNYCASGPGGYVTWSYTDPANSPQTAYEVQVTNTGNFNNLIYDSCNNQVGINTCISGNSSRTHTIPPGILAFNTTYKARVKVWNSYNSPSNWSGDTNSWTTPLYAYPQVAFTWSPHKPGAGATVQFTDQTTFATPNGHQWSWSLGDGGTSSNQNPTHVYANVGIYTIVLTATEAGGYSCSIQNGTDLNAGPGGSTPPIVGPGVTVQKPVPIIKEVAPK